ncbi:MAG TPA: YoaK family protein [Nocardioides sp.]|nr:YoaK family protein [Nocardioides sp.]
MHLVLMLALTVTTGINDAVGYLGLDKVFTGNMTGNVVVLGMALAGGSGLPVLGPALALFGYVAGAAVGGRAMRYAGTGWTRLVTVGFGTVAAIMLTLGTVLLLVDHPSHDTMVAVTTCAAVAMGIQATTARHVAVADVTTVVVTSTLTGLAADPFLGEHRKRAVRRFGAVALILLGAFIGALLLKVTLGLGLAVAGVVIALVTTIGHLTGPAARV